MKTKRQEYLKQYRQKNRDKLLVYKRAYRKAHRETYLEAKRVYYRKNRSQELPKKRARNLRKGYNISADEWQKMYDCQMGLCAACSRPETRKLNGKLVHLSVDHDHYTGEVRALLCTTCNAALGFLQEDPTRIKALLEYSVRWFKSTINDKR